MLGADWTLVYGGRRQDSMAFLDDLQGYGERVLVLPEDQHGLLDLPRWLAHPEAGVRVYCCGPSPLLDAVESACRSWPEHALRTERFVAKEQGAPVRDQPFDVVLARTGTTVSVGLDRTVLDAVRGAGVDVLSSCQQGTCGTCETDVVEGTPDHRDSILGDSEREANDCMFICVSRSCSDRLVLDI
jgi:ferredoxin